MNKKMAGLLGLAARARKLASGDAVLQAVRQNKAKLVLLSTDCSRNSQKKIQDICRFYGVVCIVDGTVDELSAALGQPHRIAVAVLDEGFARSMQKAYEMR